MEPKKLEGLIKTYSIKCNGTDKHENPVLSDKQKEPVIVKIHRNGRSTPLCKYLCGDYDSRCSASLNEDDKGICPYKS